MVFSLPSDSEDGRLEVGMRQQYLPPALGKMNVSFRVSKALCHNHTLTKKRSQKSGVTIEKSGCYISFYWKLIVLLLRSWWDWNFVCFTSLNSIISLEDKQYKLYRRTQSPTERGIPPKTTQLMSSWTRLYIHLIWPQVQPVLTTLYC